MKKYCFASLTYLALSFLAYGVSLPYSFVYDDLPRIVTNDWFRDPVSTKEAFVNPQTQSSLADLNSHTYRPLLTLDLWLSYRLANNRPAVFRFQNLLFHGLNAFLVFLLGRVLFSMSWVWSLAAGMIFLLHPTQIESVVWISELSNPISLFCMLLGTVMWVYRKVVATLGCLIIALLFRESAVCFPFLMLGATVLARREEIKKDVAPIAIAGAIVVLFAAIRTFVLGTVGQNAFYGGRFSTQVLTAFSVVPKMFQMLLVPTKQSVQHDMAIVSHVFDPTVLVGLLLLVCLCGLSVLFWRKDKRMTFFLTGILVFWAPTSNIVPLTHLFNERWLYGLMIFFAWLAAALFERVSDRSSRFAARAACGFLVMFYLFQIKNYLPVWRNNMTLWDHAVATDPSSWFSHFSLGVAERDEAERRKDPVLFQKAGQSFLSALALGPSRVYAPGLWLHLAEINLYLNSPDQAERCAREAIALDPEVAAEWEQLRRRFSFDHKL